MLRLTRGYILPSRRLFLCATAVSFRSSIRISFYSTKNGDDAADPPKSSAPKPWYLQQTSNESRIDTSSPFIGQVQLPKTAVPTTITSITAYLRDKLGMTDIVCFKTSESHRPSVKSGYIIICSAKSNRHGARSVVELMKFVKTEYDVLPTKEGGISAQEMRKRYRRIQRRGTLSTASVMNGTDSDWYLVDCKVRDSEGGIYVHILTTGRREELNLEELYCTQEEKQLYIKTPKTSDDTISFDSDDDNVLAGLKRLALKNSRRYYSTSASASPGSSLLYDTLSVQDYDAANEAGGELRDVVKALGDLSQNTAINTTKWIEIFESRWPFVDLTETHWQLRWEFYEMLFLNKLNKCYTALDNGVSSLCEPFSELRRSVDDLLKHFSLKQSMNGVLTREELLSMLDVINAQIDVSKSFKNMHFVPNEMVVVLLNHYRHNNADIFTDEGVLLRILQSMDNSQAKPYVSYEFINFIVNSGSDTRNVILLCIEIFSKNKDWKKLLSLIFNRSSPTHCADPEVWTALLESVVENGDQHIISTLLDKGYLLWLKRHKLHVKGHDRLNAALTELFRKAGVITNRHQDLCKYLLN
ncbi:Atp25p Ecym_7409 [Eremothecium cymbalariae DBVPG|uniref:ATPase synthesis protein 25 n=1 Tax=Eremothecium cymbalariae (strain CBS 270.75 / DBVPG 7215 / KCTC 17166 / NRRL Y-17582) TaxID=931890 RepID=G8JWM0_ERECY|nr:hypothetical protein Ecym_7409 [Eremothecium cymbalariae DBVPG\